MPNPDSYRSRTTNIVGNTQGDGSGTAYNLHIDSSGVAKTSDSAVATAISNRPTYQTLGGTSQNANRLVVDVSDLAIGAPSASATALARVGMYGQDSTDSSKYKLPLVTGDGHLIIQKGHPQLPSTSSIFSAAPIAAGATSQSLSVDTAYAREITIMGEVSQSGVTLNVQHSIDDSTFYTDPTYITIGSDNQFVYSFETGMRYVRLQIINGAGSSTTIGAIAGYKNETVAS